MSTIPCVITYEEWLNMPAVQDGVDEIVDGEYRLTPPVRYAHAEILRRLNRLFDRQVDETKVAIYDSNFGLLISQNPLICRSPALAVYFVAEIKIQDGLFCSPPGLIVEVLSPSETRSRKDEKLHDYAALGVPEAWIISPEAETIEVRELHEGRLQRTAIIAEGELRPTRFPNVSIPVSASLWPELR
jgi:Uma2 family endonuclease